MEREGERQTRGGGHIRSRPLSRAGAHTTVRGRRPGRAGVASLLAYVAPGLPCAHTRATIIENNNAGEQETKDKTRTSEKSEPLANASAPALDYITKQASFVASLCKLRSILRNECLTNQCSDEGDARLAVWYS